jgi:hypothetical protein
MATGLLTVFKYFQNEATGNRTDPKCGQLQPMVWLHSVQFSLVSVIFSVALTGPLNTNHEHAFRLTPDGHADKPDCLDNLGNSFAHRFEHSGDLMDIDKAISYHEHAVHLTPDGHADKPGRLNNLGNSFLCQFQHSQDLMDVDKAISHHEHAVCVTPDHRETEDETPNLCHVIYH